MLFRGSFVLSEWLYRIGLKMKIRGHYYVAAFVLRVATALNRYHADAFFELGMVFGNIGLFRMAIRSFQSVISIAPEFQLAHYNLGATFIDIEDYDNASKALETAVSLDPSDYDGHYLLATTYQYKGEHAQALSEFKEAIRIDPRESKALERMGITLDELGRYEEAAQAYRRAIESDSQNGAAHIRLGEILTERGSFVDAIDHLLTGIKLIPSRTDNYKIYRTIALAFRGLGRWQEASEYHEKAVSWRPKDPQLLGELGEALVKTGDPLHRLSVARLLPRLRDLLLDGPFHLPGPAQIFFRLLEVLRGALALDLQIGCVLLQALLRLGDLLAGVDDLPGPLFFLAPQFDEALDLFLPQPLRQLLLDVGAGRAVLGRGETGGLVLRGARRGRGLRAGCHGRLPGAGAVPDRDRRAGAEHAQRHHHHRHHFQSRQHHGL